MTERPGSAPRDSGAAALRPVGALGVSLAVTAIAVLGSFGVLPLSSGDGNAADPAAKEAGADHRRRPWHPRGGASPSPSASASASPSAERAHGREVVLR